MDRRRPRNPPIRPLVLIVGAHEDTRAVDLALSAEGFDVITVQDSGDAFRQAWAIHPDIIVADLPMPTHDGWPFLESLKQIAAQCDRQLASATGVATGARTVGFSA
jgi:DNA-binding response OmpR family regulator